ncbi:MAG: complex I NDUFA9 subunit family protein [Alphaproteobacteria bacterium]|nr:complex I NDUFA9 subunit family protein [Alphaproteobacteria bacterium]
MDPVMKQTDPVMKYGKNEKLVTIFGGSGFVGRHLVQRLAHQGYRIRVAVRRPELANYLRPLGNVGQIHPLHANIRDPCSVARAIEGTDVVINLAAILFEKGPQTFKAIHHHAACRIAQATLDAGITQLIHISALGAESTSPSLYARSKAAGEKEILHFFPEAIIFRPSLVFGPEDQVFNRFAILARLLPFLPLIGSKTRFQPVFVSDFTKAIARAIEEKTNTGIIYEIGGPEVLTLRELVEKTLSVIQRRCLILEIPFPLAKLLAVFFQLLPRPLFTLDQIHLLKQDNIVSETAIKQGKTLEGLGIKPCGMETILPSYLTRFRRTGQFEPPQNMEKKDI